MISPNVYQELLNIDEKLFFLERLSEISKTAPKSMHPRRIEEHVDLMCRFFRRHLFAPEEDVEKLCSAMKKFYLSFKPSNVNSYAESLKDFMVAAIKLYK